MFEKSFNEMYEVDVSQWLKAREKTPDVKYLPWTACKKILHDYGAEQVMFWPVPGPDGCTLRKSELEFLDKNGVANRCYEVLVSVEIDENRYLISYPVMNGINPVRDNLMNQNAVHKAQMRAFVKAVAINTGLGFDLWLDDADIEEDGDDLTKHSLFAIKERMQIAYTRAFKNGMTTKEIAEKVGMTEDEVKVIFTYFDQLHRFEQKLSAL